MPLEEFMKEIPEWKKRIITEQQEKTNELNLSNCNLSVIPDQLLQMPWLKKLDLANNQITRIENLENLVNLELLYFENNKLSKIENVEKLENLTVFFLSDNQVSKIENLEKSSKLQSLYLRNNQVEKIENLEALKSLSQLNLGGNRIDRIVNLEKNERLYYINLEKNKLTKIENLAGLENLTELNLGENQISKLENLPNNKFLERLDLNKNYIEDIGELLNIGDLKILGLSNNRISDISSLAKHTKLQEVYLSQNPLKSIAVLEHLPDLKRVILSNTGLTSLRPLLPIIKNGIPVKTVYGFEDSSPGIYIRDNDNLDISKEFISQGNEAIIQFYNLQSNKSTALDEIYLNEAKLILVGEGKVGKTSLRVKLINTTAALPRDDERTRGIDINDYTFQLKNQETYIAHIWDFGGQNIQYALHRFFMTENSLYILMTESRNERDKNFMYWFQNIDLFGGKDSPILIVMNLMYGDRGSNIDIASYVGEFNKIVNNQILEVNLLDPSQDNGLQKLRVIIEQQLENLPHISKPIFRCWLDVRQALQEKAKKHNYIDMETYQEICLANNVEEPYFEILGRYMHNLGIVLWYHDKEFLRNKMILNPLWAISAIYKIIDDKKIQDNKGQFDNTDRDRLWNDAAYKYSKDELTSLLKVFKICFQRQDKNEYIVPALMEANPPTIARDWDNTDARTVTFEYVFMPKGIANQLTADMHQHIKDELNHVWAYGVVLHYAEDNSTTAMITENTYNRFINIQVKGNYANRFMGIIIQELKNINNSYMGLRSEMKIPCICEKCITLAEPQLYTEKDLLEKLNEGKTTVYCNKLDEKIEIKPILESIGITHPLFKKLQDRGTGNKPGAGSGKKKLFISYSHENTRWVKKLRTQLSGLRLSGLIDDWTDQEILAGQKWDAAIKEKMETADVFVCLLSADFIASEYIWNTELKAVFDSIKIRNATVIFVYVESFDLDSLQGAKLHDQTGETTILDFEIIPKDDNGHLIPAALWKDENLALTTIAKRIREVIQKGKS